MKVLFTSLREKSHFLALTPFIRAVQRTGHEVAVAAPPDFAERVAALGTLFFPVGHPGDEGLAPTWQRMREVPREQIARFAVGELFADVCAGAAIPSVIEILEHFRPSVVVRESFEFAGHVAAEKVGIPHVRAAICGSGAELDIRADAAASVNKHRRVLGLSSDPEGNCLAAEPVVTLFPPSFDLPATEPNAVARFHTPRTAATGLADHWNGNRDPFVYVTLGTVTGGFGPLAAVFRQVLDALVDLPVRALLTVGADLPLDVLGEVPTNVHVERFVPQDEVIPHAAAVLCHGGSGTVLGALAAGVPLVVAPLFADQPYNAARVTATGAGIGLESLDAPSSALRAALTRVLREDSFRATARRFADEIAALPMIDEVGPTLERFSR
jgi:UDP:flavonoid glycosyltransferase YjiC (YdhE family)